MFLLPSNAGRRCAPLLTHYTPTAHHTPHRTARRRDLRLRLCTPHLTACVPARRRGEHDGTWLAGRTFWTTRLNLDYVATNRAFAAACRKGRAGARLREHTASLWTIWHRATSSAHYHLWGGLRHPRPGLLHHLPLSSIPLSRHDALENTAKTTPLRCLMAPGASTRDKRRSAAACADTG